MRIHHLLVLAVGFFVATRATYVRQRPPPNLYSSSGRALPEQLSLRSSLRQGTSPEDPSGLGGDPDTADEYSDASTMAPVGDMDNSEDFDQFEVSEYEDPVTKSYHCTVRDQATNVTFQPNTETLKFFDDNGLMFVRPKKTYYQVRQVRRKMCQFGFDPFQPDNRVGSIHKRFKNTLRLMIYNTPGMFPSLRVVRNDLDRKRKREPQIWFRFDLGKGPLSAEFDYDNYFVTITGDIVRTQAYSRMLVALKMHKKLNNFNDPISYKVNLDLGIIEVILTTFGIWVMRDKAIASLMVNALNGIRTEVNDKGTVQLEFEETLKEAADQVDPLLYSYIWLLAMAEKYDVVRTKERSQVSSARNSTEDQELSRRKRRHAPVGVIEKINIIIDQIENAAKMRDSAKVHYDVHDAAMDSVFNKLDIGTGSGALADWSADIVLEALELDPAFVRKLLAWLRSMRDSRSGEIEPRSLSFLSELFGPTRWSELTSFTHSKLYKSYKAGKMHSGNEMIF